MPLRVLWRRIRIVAGVALALALIALVAWLALINWRPSPAAFPRQGINVSEAQGPVDWFKVKAASRIDFAYARATIGADRRDKGFAAHWKGMFEAGIPRGAIHVFSLCQLASDQAGNFVAAVHPASDQLAMALELDFAPDCGARPDRGVVLLEIGNFLRAVEAHTAKPAILRVARAFEARYRVSEGIPRRLWSIQSFFPPSYFDKPWTMWQANAIRRIEGVTGPVSWDVMAR